MRVRGADRRHRWAADLLSTDGGPRARTPPAAASRWSGVLVGVGVAAFVDETVFHQLLHWHHFYDRSTPEVGLVSDGVFHAFGWFALVAGLFWFSGLRKQDVLVPRRWVSGLLLGAGAFQLYDGTVHHKLLALHQIRYDVDLLPYDLIWNLLAVALVLAGVALGRRPAPDVVGGA